MMALCSFLHQNGGNAIEHQVDILILVRKAGMFDLNFGKCRPAWWYSEHVELTFRTTASTIVCR
ncbi:hypothetical protein BDZ89DRAFT_1070025 [Hymenopellis radicata]|nr:hypothetical protein BDZ89DRAFT_1070025 [Hymenopellis radicata]